MSKKKAYVIGTNVSTSISPTIFQYWFNKYNIDAEYEYKEIKEQNFDVEIKSMLKEDGLVGFNITIPYKEKIFSYIDNKAEGTHPTISLKNPPINCVTIKKPNDPDYFGFKIYGENTDIVGFNKALYNSDAFDVSVLEKNSCAIVLGYGGAAKAIINSLILSENFKRIMVFNRTFDKLNNLDEIFNNETEPHKLEDLHKNIKNAQLIVNTTPVNILKTSPNWDINPNCVGFDVVYKPWEGTGFLKYFKPDKRIEGIYMLVYQAAPCFKNWFGVEPEIDNDQGLFKNLYEKMNEK